MLGSAIQSPKACETRSWGLRFKFKFRWEAATCDATVMGPLHRGSPSAWLSEFGGSLSEGSGGQGRSKWRLGVSCCEFRIHPQACSGLCAWFGSVRVTVGLGAESQQALVGRLATGLPVPCSQGLRSVKRWAIAFPQTWCQRQPIVTVVIISESHGRDPA